MEKEQFNARIPKDLKSAALTASARLGWNNEELVKLAFSHFFGSRDTMIKAKRGLAVKVAKELNLTFKEPEVQDQGIAA